jgi:prophage tail gpP-like protein
VADILIKINGWPFTDWNNLLISKDIESVAGSFEFNLVSKDEEWFPLMEGNQVEILHGKTPVLTGFIDFVGPDLDADDRTIIVSGRDNTGDLVDCTYDGNKTEFVGEQGIDVIATELISQYKDSISLISKLDQVPVLSKFKYDPGEKIWEALERAASEAGVIFQPSGGGDLILTKLASVPEPVKLIEGENILRRCPKITCTT